MKKLKTILSISAMIISLTILAQQQAMFTQYMFNATAINPAVTGTHGAMSITGLLREQWSGIEGAPSTKTLSLHSPAFRDRVGLGLTVLQDEIGVTRQQSFFGSYAYRIQFANATLSLGLQFGGSTVDIRESRLNPNDPDLMVGQDFQTGFMTNFGVGAYFYTDRFYIGASAPMLRESSDKSDSDDGSLRTQRHYFLATGYVFELNRSLKLKPNVLIKAVEGAPLNFDLNANLLIKEIVWVGASYRSFDSISGILELQITPQLRVGYAHDFTVSDLKQVNNGTHELMANYRLSFKNKKTITPRYF